MSLHGSGEDKVAKYKQAELLTIQSAQESIKVEMYCAAQVQKQPQLQVH